MGTLLVLLLSFLALRTRCAVEDVRDRVAGESRAYQSNHFKQPPPKHGWRGLNPLRHEDRPVPGGVGYGYFMYDNALRWTNSTIADYYVIAPRVLGGTVSWLYLTSTVRAPLGTESLVAYSGQNQAEFSIFDWSQTAGNPWQVVIDLPTDHPQYLTTRPDEFGVTRQMIHLRNGTFHLGFTSGLHNWRNQVMLFNFTRGDWDLMYLHDYTTTNLTDNTTANGEWAPIVETFDSYTNVNTVGFDLIRFFQDNNPNPLWLTPANSYFNQSSPWQLLDETPNTAFAVAVSPTTLSRTNYNVGALSVRVNTNAASFLLSPSGGQVSSSWVMTPDSNHWEKTIAALTPASYSINFQPIAGLVSPAAQNFSIVSNQVTTIEALYLPPSACTPPAAGIVSWWRAQGNAQDAIGTNNGVLNGVTFGTGIVGQAFYLQGQYVNVPDSPTLFLTNRMTVEAWIYMTNATGQRPIVEKYGSTGGFGFRVDAGKLEFFTADNSSTASIAVGATSLTSNQWYHVAGEWDGTRVAVYVNGILDGSLVTTRNPKSSPTPLRIGARGDDTLEKFAGFIDEPAIYNRALSSNEIASVYQAGSFGKCLPSGGGVTPQLVWTNPPAIVYGTALSSNQLNATCSVPGTFRYLPLSGTVLNAGSNTLSVLFTPADTNTYAQAVTNVVLRVDRAAISASVDSKSRFVGQANPLFTGHINGLVNGDTAALLFSCSANEFSPPTGQPPYYYPPYAIYGFIQFSNPTNAYNYYNSGNNGYDGVGQLTVIGISPGAQPYASGVSNGDGVVSFLLNDNADEVKILVNGNVLNDMFVVPKGPYLFSSASVTNYSIIVTKYQSGLPAQVSADTNALLQFDSARGVAVNTSPKTRNFGRIYVANSTPGSATNRSVGRGLYVLNADQTDALGRGNLASTGTVTFAVSGSSPFKCSVGSDDKVYVSDFATASATTWMYDADLSVSTLLFNGIGRAANPTVHTDSSSTPVVRGSLAAGNLKVYETDGGIVPYNSIQRWDINSGPLPWNSAPSTTLGNPGINSVQDVTTDVDIGPDGKFYTSENRTAGTDADSIRVFAPDGTTLLWGSLTNLGSPDPLRQSSALAVSSDGRYLAIVHTNSQISVLPLTNGIPDMARRIIITNSPNLSTGRDVAWDAADNLYAVSDGQALLRVSSLGLASRAVTSGDLSGTNGTYQFTVLPPEPPVLAASRSNNVIRLQSTAFVGQRIQVEFTTNLTQSVWSAIAPALVVTNVPATWTDTPGTLRQRFYRAVVLP